MVSRYQDVQNLTGLDYNGAYVYVGCGSTCQVWVWWCNGVVVSWYQGVPES